MSAFKKLTSGDTFVSVNYANKRYSATSSSFGEYGITVYSGYENTGTLYQSEDKYSEYLYQRSIKHLYYDNFNGSEILYSGSYDHYLETSLFSGSRFLHSTSSIFSFPKEVIGTYINPSSFSLNLKLGIESYKFQNLGTNSEDDQDACSNYPNLSSTTLYGNEPVLADNSALYTDRELTSTFNGGSDFFSDGQTVVQIDGIGNVVDTGVCSGGDVSGSTGLPVYSGSRFILYDDGNGALEGFGQGPDYLTSSLSTRRYEGDIMYKHGTVVLTDTALTNILTQGGELNYTASWESTYPVYTLSYSCKTRSSDFLFTQNPSACQLESVLSGSLSYSGGLPKDNVTGSEFAPYVTTVGLYNDAHELIAVAKLGQPIPKSKTNDMTFVVKFDI